MKLGNLTLSKPLEGETEKSDYDFARPNLVVHWHVDEIPRNVFFREHLLDDEVTSVITKLRLTRPLNFRIGYWKSESESVFLQGHRRVQEESKNWNKDQSYTRIKATKENSFSKSDSMKYQVLDRDIDLRITRCSPESLKGQERRVKIALDMYMRSFEKDLIMSVLFMVIGFEALYNIGGQELRLRLSLKTSALLNCLGFSKEDVCKSLYFLFKLRNKFVHGKFVKQQDMDKIRELYSKVQNYLRVSLLASLHPQFSENKWNTTIEKVQKEFLSENIEKLFDDLKKENDIDLSQVRKTICDM